MTFTSCATPSRVLDYVFVYTRSMHEIHNKLYHCGGPMETVQRRVAHITTEASTAVYVDIHGCCCCVQASTLAPFRRSESVPLSV